MLTSLESNALQFWPLRIARNDAATGSRLCGISPEGIEPAIKSEETRYFGTFPVDRATGVEVSIFYRFDHLDSDAPFFITRNARVVIDSTSEVLQCVFHDRSQRSVQPVIASELSGYEVAIGEGTIDSIDDKKFEVPHKIGGVPFFDHYPDRVRQLSRALIEAGYVHFLEWSYPGVGDCEIEGEWPFRRFWISSLYQKGGRIVSAQCDLSLRGGAVVCGGEMEAAAKNGIEWPPMACANLPRVLRQTQDRRILFEVGKPRRGFPLFPANRDSEHYRLPEATEPGGAASLPEF